MAEVTLTLREYQELERKAHDAQELVYKLEADLREVSKKTFDPIGTVHELVEKVRIITSFAVAHLDPASIRDWPHEALRDVGELLRTLPGANQHELELAGEFSSFAKEAAKFETRRAASAISQASATPG